MEQTGSRTAFRFLNIADSASKHKMLSQPIENELLIVKNMFYTSGNDHQ